MALSTSCLSQQGLRLPLDLMYEVFAILEVQDKFRCLFVCKAWHAVLMQPDASWGCVLLKLARIRELSRSAQIQSVEAIRSQVNRRVPCALSSLLV